MPIQSVKRYSKFQEKKLRNLRKRRKLGNKVRPRRCPYCGEVECMILHQWVTRFLIVMLGEIVVITLLVPVYKCKSCGRHIRVLPRQCHVHHQYSNMLILYALRLYYRDGRYVRLRWLDPSLMRCWVKKFEENARSFGASILNGLRSVLDEIPRFSILFRIDVKIMRLDETAGFSRTTQRPFTLAVCL